jgi:hypothetical protein
MIQEASLLENENFTDGKYIFLEGQNLRIYNPEDDSLITKQLGNYYEGNSGIGVIK